MPFPTLRLATLLAALALPAGAQGTGGAAVEGMGCWTHEGSRLRLHAAGAYRAFVVERPSEALAAAGVAPGAKLFEGVAEGGWIVGSATDLGAACPGAAPRRFHAEGFVLADPLSLPLAGTAEVWDGCRPTGRWAPVALRLSHDPDC